MFHFAFQVSPFHSPLIIAGFHTLSLKSSWVHPLQSLSQSLTFPIWKSPAFYSHLQSPGSPALCSLFLSLHIFFQLRCPFKKYHMHLGSLYTSHYFLPISLQLWVAEIPQFGFCHLLPHLKFFFFLFLTMEDYNRTILSSIEQQSHCWRPTAPQYCVGLCHTSTRCSHRYTCPLPPEAPLPSVTPTHPLGCHRTLG